MEPSVTEKDGDSRAESRLDRVARLALRAGKYRTERDRALAEIARLSSLCARNGIDPAPPDGA